MEVKLWMGSRGRAAAFGLFLALVMASCAGQTGGQSAPTPEAVTTQPAATPTSAQVSGEVGQELELGRLRVRVDDAGSAGVEANEFATQGMRFYVVQLSVENRGDVRFVVDPGSQMQLRDGAGRTYEISPAALTITESEPPDLELEAGNVVSGQVAFEIPEDAFGLEFVFDATAEGLGTAVIDVGG